MSDTKNNDKQTDTRKKYKCKQCTKEYAHRATLSRHKAHAHDGIRHVCPACQKVYAQKQRLRHHIRTKHLTFEDSDSQPTQSPPPDAQPLSDILDKFRSNTNLQITHSVQKNLIQFIIRQSGRAEIDLNFALLDSLPDIHSIIDYLYQNWRGLKYYLYCEALLFKPVTQLKDDDETIVAHLRTSVVTVYGTSNANIIEGIQTNGMELVRQLDEFAENGSGWNLDRILKFELNVVRYHPLSGGCRKNGLEVHRPSKSCIDVQNVGNECFKYAVLASLLSHKRVPDLSKKSALWFDAYEHYIDTTGLVYPVSLKNIDTFELKNNLIAVSVFGYSYREKEYYPIRISQKRNKLMTYVDLLLMNGHYICIRNKSRLFHRQHGTDRKKYYCDFCLNPFSTETALDSHLTQCQLFKPVKTILPTGENSLLSFKRTDFTELIDFFIVYDFESYLPKIEGADGAPNRSWTRKQQLHIPHTFCYATIDHKGNLFTKPVLYSGEDVADVFLDKLQEEAHKLLNLPTRPLEMTDDDKQRAKTTKACEKCNVLFSRATKKVLDHCHVSGRLRNILCQGCNLQLKMKKKVACIAHNMSNYDQFFILKAIAARFNKDYDKLHIIPKTREKYKAFTYNQLRFIDSYSFMQGSLDKIVKTLDPEDFSIFNEGIGNEEACQLLRNSKQSFCYEYITHPSKLEETELPPYECFYSSLKESNVDLEDYLQAVKIFNTLECRNIQDFLDIYTKCDVLLLACAMQKFRTVNYSHYGIDCLHFISAPSYYFQACLKISKVEFQLFDQPDQYLLIESGIRGGLSQVFNRTSLPNNPDVPTWDPSKPTTYGLLLDHNALYPTSQWAYKMPLKNFRWLTKGEISKLDLYNLDIHGDTGLIFHLDLHYPDEIKEFTKNFPLCPTNINITHDMLTDYQKNLLSKLGLKYPKSNRKLVATQLDKDDLVIHAVPLSVFLKLGMRVKRIHRVLCYEQSYWLRDWVELGTERRKSAKSQFESDALKGALNATFGSFLLSRRKQRYVKLIGDPKLLKHYINSPTFVGYTILSERVSAVEYRPRAIKLDRPYVLGFCTLEHAKALLYEYYYFNIYPRFQCPITLCYVDTDSYYLHVECNNIQSVLKSIEDTLDSSNYPKDHPLYSLKNKSKLLCVKDELAGRVVQEAYFLKSKCYSIKFDDTVKSKLKGVSKVAVVKRITIDQYRAAIQKDDDCIYVHQMSIQNKQFTLYTTKSNRIALNSFDDKSAYLSPTELEPYGYRKS